MSWNVPPTQATGDLITATIYNTYLVNNLEVCWHEIATSGLTGITTSVGTTPVKLADSGAATYEAVPTRFHFLIGGVDATSSNDVNVAIFDAGTDVLNVFSTATTGWDGGGISGFAEMTPAAGSHTYQLYAWMASGSFSFYPYFQLSVDQMG